MVQGLLWARTVAQSVEEKYLFIVNAVNKVQEKNKVCVFVFMFWGGKC